MVRDDSMGGQGPAPLVDVLEEEAANRDPIGDGTVSVALRDTQIKDQRHVAAEQAMISTTGRTTIKQSLIKKMRLWNLGL